MQSMKQLCWVAFLTLLYFLPARAQLDFSDSLRISLLTCSAGPDAYERFGHAGIRILDLKKPQNDVTFHYGVFSFNTPHFVYRFVKGETDYQLGAQYTSDFVAGYNFRGLGMIEQSLRLDSAQCQEVVHRLLVNYLPENRTYRYSYFFDNCSTRPYHLINASTSNSIRYDSAWVKEITLRQMVQQKTHLDNWLDFGIALAVAGRADVPASFEEQLFLPEYLSKAADNALIPTRVGDEDCILPLVTGTETLLEMDDEVAAEIAAPDTIRPAALFGILLMLALILSALEWRYRQNKAVKVCADSFDCLWYLFLGITGLIVWFLNFFSEHPAVDHNINCFWLLPTHVIFAVLLWFKKMRKCCSIYFGITFALVIVYVVFDWMTGQYCPPPFLLILATILLRSFIRMRR